MRLLSVNVCTGVAAGARTPCMPAVSLILPHQLFERHPAIARGRLCVLVEETLLFSDSRYPLRLHKKHLLLHRASMKAYAVGLAKAGHDVRYVEWKEGNAITKVLGKLAREGFDEFHYCDPVDYILELRLRRFFEESGLSANVHSTPMFLTPDEWRRRYFHRTGRKRYLMANFYEEQRKRMGVLLDADGEPKGGRWSYDEDNRKRLPKTVVPPAEPSTAHRGFAGNCITEAAAYVDDRFAKNYGEVEGFDYPVTHRAAQSWLEKFLEERFAGFGDYEDAISMQHRVLYHSVLTPMLNVGLLTPQEVLDAALDHAAEHRVPLNSTEGFVRQIIGWREFMRGVYVENGVQARTTNFWGFSRRMPEAFYTGQTGIPPVDEVIRNVLAHGWCHHIERLMVLGCFMLLCRIHPDDVYAWFMEMFVDAYDWVMVPNVYGMSQFADGGSFTTKPYLCGSNYILKMSDYPRGPWCAIWDALFWTFIEDYEEFFLSNARLGMMARQLAKMRGPALREKRNVAGKFLESL
jgi:deoxyribodipyrimidine photolyase-related protein